MLELQKITKVYNPGEITEVCVFRDFSLTVGDGEFVSVVGSNGSGKTSMLNIVCGSSAGLLDQLQPFDVVSFTGSADTAALIRSHPAVALLRRHQRSPCAAGGRDFDRQARPGEEILLIHGLDRHFVSEWITQSHTL